MVASSFRAFLLAASAVVAFAADTIEVTAVQPKADERGLIPAVVQFTRLDATSTQMVFYRISGTGVSDLHGGHVVGAALASTGAGYINNWMSPVVVTGSTPVAVGTASAGQPTLNVASIGGRVTSIAVTAGGSGYVAGETPAVTITDSYGTGAAGSAAVSGSVIAVAVTTAGQNYTVGDTLTFIGGGVASQAQVRVTGVDASGAITTVSVTSGGSGYAAAPATVSGGTGSGAALTATLEYRLDTVTVTSVGTGYRAPVVTVAAPASGLGTAGLASATVTGSPLNGVSVADGGYGIAVPAVTVTAAAGSGAVLRPVIQGGALIRLVVEAGGSGYSTPTVSIPGGTTLATASTRVVGGATGGTIDQVVLLTQGAGYADGTHAATVTDAVTGATANVQATAVGGKIVAIQLISSQSTFAVPTVAIAGAGGAIGTVSVENGQVVAATLLSAGAGYGLANVAVDDLVTGGETQGTVSLRVASPDYYVLPDGAAVGGRQSMGAWVDAASGDLRGVVTFAAGAKAASLVIVPFRNGAGGGRDLRVAIEPSSAYTTNERSATEVRIGDMDDEAVISTIVPVAYPVPTRIDQAQYPTEVDGRAESRIDLTGDVRTRRLSVQFTGDGTYPRATIGQDADCLLVWNSKSIPETVTDFVVAANKEKVPPYDVGPAKAGDTSIWVQGLSGLDVGMVVMFEGAGVEPQTSGIYVITGFVDATDADNPAIVIAPALHNASCVAGSTRIRVLGNSAFYGRESVAADATSTLIHDLYGSSDTLYYFVFPYRQSAARGARSMVAKLLETDDYRVTSPTTANMTVADTAVVARVQHGGNAGQPSTAGWVDVTFSTPFPSDTEVSVPFTVLDSSTAQLTVYDDPNTTANEYVQNHVTVTGVDPSTRRGVLKIPGGSNTGRIWITPSGNAAETAAKTVDIRLDASYDYQFGPQGTSAANTMASVTVSPIPLTALGRPVRVAFSTAATVNAAEPATDGSVTIALVDAAGVPLADADSVTSAVAIAYSATGSAVSGVNYQALSGTATIPAGAKSVVVPIRLRDDGTVTDDLSLVLTLAGGAGYQVTGTANAAVLIRDGGPRFSVALTTGAIRPGTRAGTNGRFTITNSRPSTQSVTVTYAVSGAAVSGTDFSALTGFVTFPPGATSVPVDVIPLAGDASTTSLTLSLSASGSPVQYLLESPSQATMTLAAPLAPIQPTTTDGKTVSVSVARVSDGAERGLVSGAFRLSLTDAAGASLGSSVLASDLTVVYTVSGSAQAATNYQALSGSAVIPAGQTSVDVPILVLNDGAVGDTQVVITLPSSNWPSALSSATVTIVDGSPLVTVSSSASPLIQGGAASGSFTVTVDAVQTRDLTVRYTAGGTAVAGQDYIALSGSVTVLAGQTSATIPVVPTDLRLSTTEPRLVLTVVAETGTRSYGLGGTVQAAVTIRAPYTSQSEAVSIAVQSRRDATEAGVTGVLRFYLADSAGAALAGTLSQAVTVGYSVSGTAVPAVNYQRLSGSAVIPAGQPYVDVPVTAINDGVSGTRLTVTAGLDSGAWYGVSSQASASVVIGDGALPVVRITAPAEGATAYQDGATGYVFVYADAVQTAPLAVAYGVSGTAVAGVDYATLPGSVTIPTGSQYATIPVSALSGTLSRSAPVVTMTLLSSPSGSPAYLRGTTVEGSVTISAPVTTTPTPRVTVGAGGGSSGCGAGSGIGLVLAGAGLALTTLRRRRRS